MSGHDTVTSAAVKSGLVEGLVEGLLGGLIRGWVDGFTHAVGYHAPPEAVGIAVKHLGTAAAAAHDKAIKFPEFSLGDEKDFLEAAAIAAGKLGVDLTAFHLWLNPATKARLRTRFRYMLQEFDTPMKRAQVIKLFATQSTDGERDAIVKSIGLLEKSMAEKAEEHAAHAIDGAATTIAVMCRGQNALPAPGAGTGWSPIRWIYSKML